MTEQYLRDSHTTLKLHPSQTYPPSVYVQQVPIPTGSISIINADSK